MTLKNAAIFTALTTIVLGSAAFANPKADTNQDGVITRAEFMAASDARFAKTDINSDGYISKDEQLSARENHHAERRAEHFARIDTNGDGFISKDEFAQAGEMRKEKHHDKRRDRMDVNKDGKFDEADRQAFREKMESRRERFKDKFKDRDGQRGAFGRRGGKHKFDIDVNGDDLISAQEYRSGAEKMFDHMDVNGNGQLTEGEGRGGKRHHRRKGFGGR